MSTDHSASAADAPDAVFVVDTFAYFQPIRLPAERFRGLHRATERQLSAFVGDHLRRFPQRAAGSTERPAG